ERTEASHLRRAEPAERQHPVLAEEPLHRLVRLRRKPRLDVAIGGDDGDARAGDLAGGEGEEEQRARIGGVEVVEEDEERPLLAACLEETADAVEEVKAIGIGAERRAALRALAEERGDRGRSISIADEHAEDLDPRPVGRGAARFPGATPGDLHARGGGAPAGLLEERGL